MAELRPHASAIRASGGELVIVGNGAPFFAQGFREALQLGDIPLYTDESRRSYELLGFRRDLRGVLSLRVFEHGRRAMKKGFAQKKTMGDALQLGGTLVIRPGGEVVYRYASEVAGDHPRPADVVAALRRAAAATPPATPPSPSPVA